MYKGLDDLVGHLPDKTNLGLCLKPMRVIQIVTFEVENDIGLRQRLKEVYPITRGTTAKKS